MPARTCSNAQQREWAIRAARLIAERGERITHLSMRRAFKEIGAPFETLMPLYNQGITTASLSRAVGRSCVRGADD